MSNVYVVAKTTWDEQGEDHYETLAVFSDEELAETFLDGRVDSTELVVHTYALDPFEVELRDGKRGWAIGMSTSGRIKSGTPRNLNAIPYDGSWTITHSNEVEIAVVQVDMAQAELRAAEAFGRLVAEGKITPKEQT